MTERWTDRMMDEFLDDMIEKEKKRKLENKPKEPIFTKRLIQCMKMEDANTEIIRGENTDDR